MIEVAPSGDVFQLKITAVEGEGEPFTFPIEPRVSVRRRNRIIRKYPQKGLRGSIKERWMVDDFDVTIRACFIGEAGYLGELRQRLAEQTPKAPTVPDNTLGSAVERRIAGEARRLAEFGEGFLPAQAAGALSYLGALKTKDVPVQPIDSLAPAYPQNTLHQLLELCKKVHWQVSGHQQLNAFNITHLAVYDIDLPFTAGELNQEVVIRAFSDNENE